LGQEDGLKPDTYAGKKRCDEEDRGVGEAWEMVASEY